ncbi:cysteine--tRNA ligase [Patescibacteria group bacterium]|nr:cysteine--tRNA ligase [Patescibacteria group bacterium]
MVLKLYNSLTRKLEVFKPLKKGKVSIYACGPTVYQEAHIGNLRTYIFEDILRRTLEYNGYKVKHVMNITDVGHLTSDEDEGMDKVEVAAKKSGLKANKLTKHYTDLFKRDLKDLNIEFPAKFASATKYIKEQIALIKKLERRGYTYATNDGIYFDTQKFKNYGRLAKIKLGKARVCHSSGKKNIADFALWKLSLPNENRQQEWASPWGRGYPGWHLECSAISTKELGQPFDIHLGGEDHIAIHHNNEIAQSEAATSKPLAKYFVHGAFMIVGKDKMSKSKGNFLTLVDLEKQGFSPTVFRYLAVTSHYRSKLNFSRSAMIGAQNSLYKLQEMFLAKKQKGKILKNYKQKFLFAINDNLNLPSAMKIIWELEGSKSNLADKQATLLDFDKVLGFGFKNYKAPAIPTKIKKLAEERERARTNKDWKKSDKLRGEIEKLGYEVLDTSSGYIIKPLF